MLGNLRQTVKSRAARRRRITTKETKHTKRAFLFLPCVSSISWLFGSSAISFAGIFVGPVDSFSRVCAFADGPKQASRFAVGIGLEFNLEIGCFSEEFPGRFCEEDKADVAHGGNYLALLVCDFDKVIRTRFVASGV